MFVSRIVCDIRAASMMTLKERGDQTSCSVSKEGISTLLNHNGPEIAQILHAVQMTASEKVDHSKQEIQEILQYICSICLYDMGARSLASFASSVSEFVLLK